MLCRRREDNVVVHRPILGPFDDVDLVSLGNLDQVLQVNLLNLLKNDIDRLEFGLGDGPMAGWFFTRAPDHRSLILSHTGRVLIARAPGDGMDLVQGEIDSSACFLPITTADFNALRDIVQSLWMVQSDEPPQPARAELGPGFMLRIGSMSLDVRWNVPFDLSEFPHRLTVVREGWRIDRVFRYRPLVYFTAFGDAAVVEQLSISLQSLVGPGAFSGDVAVLTDLDAAQIHALRPRDMRGHLVMIRCDAADRTARHAARLALPGWTDAFSFQPILYADTDVMFDRPVDPLLQPLAMMDRLAAPLAPPELAATLPAFGGTLLLDDAWDPSDLQGFRTCVLGIPNLSRHSHTLDLIGRIMRNRASLFGRESLPDAEQAVANYVSFRMANFDTGLIGAFLREADGPVDEEDCRGLVHFGSVPAAVRVAAMRDYLGQIGGVLPGDVVPPDDVAAYSMNPVLDFETIMQSLQR